MSRDDRIRPVWLIDIMHPLYFTSLLYLYPISHRFPVIERTGEDGSPGRVRREPPQNNGRS
ncbi:hypothetical protein BC938DRAFT_472942 [Jimgerdemannia flammicorona]|uniref:Uncharacterized protein n=1 Tax=Jimgerdemannia flammicorona TaxID=994334 RepID=A0A433Q533_9FUNG|nr:hypothetical protein BC938DRAFT_472942 [Jimgerdemannia flammicorona]